MKTDSKYPQQPRYDLYIVTENVGETEDSEVSDGGHLNASYAASDTDERLSRVSTPGPRTEERLRVEITDQPALDKDSQEEDGIVLKPVKVSHSPLFVRQWVNLFLFQAKKRVNFSLDQKSILPSLHRDPAERYKPREDREPRCFPVFRWGVMLIGIFMLLVVVIILGQLILDFDSKYSKSLSRSLKATTVPNSSLEDPATATTAMPTSQKLLSRLKL